jgi:hypothetical protein
MPTTASEPQVVELILHYCDAEELAVLGSVCRRAQCADKSVLASSCHAQETTHAAARLPCD